MATGDTDRANETEDTDALESLVERQAQMLDRQERLISDLRQTVADQQETIDTLHTRFDVVESNAVDSSVSRRSVLKAGGVLSLPGVGIGTTSADPEPTGQVGTEDRPIETLYTASLGDSITSGDEVTDLVGGGLTVEDGTLRSTTDLADLEITEFSVSTVGSVTESTAGITVEESNGVETALREPVVLRKIIGTLRNDRGMFVHETVLSLLATWRQQGRNSYEELSRVARNNEMTSRAQAVPTVEPRVNTYEICNSRTARKSTLREVMGRRES